jgi:hypothetical protein
MEQISRGERSPLNKRTEVIEYLKQKLAIAIKNFDDFNRNVNHYKDTKVSPIPSPIRPGVISDGGSDLQDWKVESGVGKYEAQQEEYFSSPEAEETLRHLEDLVEHLKEDLEEIERGNENELTFEHYRKELGEVQK